MLAPAIPAGLCQCGCGRETSIARRTNASRGHVKGQPVRFVIGHKPWRDELAYTVEDRGFETPCHIWSSRTTTSGYGCLTVDGRDIIASRYIYEQAHGRLPHWHECHVDHKCRVPACVRLDHLEAVTAAENIRRGLSAKLTARIVAEIRSLCQEGWVQRDIAAAYGVSPQQITKIRRDQRWVAPGGVVHA